MASVLLSTHATDDRSDPCVAEFVRLRRELRQLAQQLDHVESELRRLLGDLMQQRLGEYD
jgi:hypothetical protein